MSMIEYGCMAAYCCMTISHHILAQNPGVACGCSNQLEQRSKKLRKAVALRSDLGFRVFWFWGVVYSLRGLGFKYLVFSGL